LQKKFADDRLKLTASGRYDKNEFFDGFVSPRLSLGYTLGENRNHNIRASVQQGFRNPTTQDLFIGLNAGSAILVGSAPTNLDRDVRTFDVSAGGQAFTGSPTVQITGRSAYENAFTLASVQAGAPAAANPGLVQPEEITAFELGYRAQINRKVSVDLSGYYNSYSNFIANVTTLVPFYGQVGDNGLSLLALQNGDFQAYQAYTNSTVDINSYGASLGIDANIGGFDVGGSYTYTKLDYDEAANPDLRTNFNTPEHKFKLSFGKTDLFKNFGFGVNYRWSDSFFWEASFADGEVPSFSVLDAQINFQAPKIKSVFKAGGSNLLGDEYFTAVGTGNIGSIYYVSWTINP